jgi:enediyne biosynthesis protein E4
LAGASFPPGNQPPASGAGCAFLDYDNDGWMDVYLVNSGRCDFFEPQPPLRNALYRNNSNGTFTDVTERAGVQGGGYGMGVAAGDCDADGWTDLYVTQYGHSILYRNNHDGTFTDVTIAAGAAAPGWAPFGSITTTTEGLICSCAGSLISISR